LKAAVLREVGAPLQIEEVELDAPGPREVRVRTVASGVCHSDLHVIEGENPWELPLVLGHEPAGVVEAIGSLVSAAKVGDHVIACSSAFCGVCAFCAAGKTHLCGGMATLRAEGEPSRLSQGGKPVGQFAYLSSFAEEMLLHENSIAVVREDMPLDRASLLGCGVLTGVGAVLNTARVRPGETAVVIGCGGVGLSVVQGLKIAGASRIVAIDTLEWKLDLAVKLGATERVLAGDDAVAEVLESTSGGVDYAFECIGNKHTVPQALNMLKSGGVCLLVGLMPVGERFEFPGFDLVLGAKTLQGSLMGSNQFRVDIPRLVEFYLAGTLNLDDMISERLPLERVNTAFDALREGRSARSVIVFDPAPAT
jgi:S-(hydroxymethyl)glutathione dehydrogenase/alcohol dehydrogenase